MAKSKKPTLGEVSALVRRRAGDASQAPELRRQLVADFCKLLGDPNLTTTASPPEVEPELPRRLRQTLNGLLAGDSEKQIAHKLSISPHTVHIYVKTLYRRFEVCSRGELLSRWIKPQRSRSD